MFTNSFPYSYAGLSLSLPIFRGFWRLDNIRRSDLQEEMIEQDMLALKSQIQTEYSTALSDYESNLDNYTLLHDNVVMAKEVYDIVYLQYQQGTVPYLNVITAQSNLITSETGYTTALYQLLSSKIALEKAMGLISPNGSNTP